MLTPAEAERLRASSSSNQHRAIMPTHTYTCAACGLEKTSSIPFPITRTCTTCRTARAKASIKRGFSSIATHGCGRYDRFKIGAQHQEQIKRPKHIVNLDKVAEVGEVGVREFWWRVCVWRREINPWGRDEELQTEWDGLEGREGDEKKAELRRSELEREDSSKTETTWENEEYALHRC